MTRATVPSRVVVMTWVAGFMLLLSPHLVLADLDLQLSPPSITVGAYPVSMALAPNGDKLYVVNANPERNPRQASLSVIDTSSRTVIETIWLGTGFGAEQMAVTPDGTRAYVANSSHVDVVDLVTSGVTIIGTGSTSALMSGIAITPDGKRAYATDRQLNRIVVIDTDPESASFHGVITTMTTPALPYAVGVTPDGSRVYIGSGPNIEVFETTTNTLTATIPLVAGPSTGSKIVFTPNGRRGYAATRSSALAILDTDPLSATFNQRIDEIDLGSETIPEVIDVVLGANGTVLVVVATSPTSVLIVDTEPESSTFKAVLGALEIERLGSGSLIYRGVEEAFAYAMQYQDPGNVAVVVATPPPYTFSGFFSPVDNLPVINAANAGQTVPVKWQLTLPSGPVADPSSFVSITSYSVNCETLVGNPVSAVQEYVAGSSGLQFLGDGHWQWNWKTPKSYANTCRLMVLSLSDGSMHTARFQFK
jgi:DNA-binding beta-propeller fold protein YncE